MKTIEAILGQEVVVRGYGVGRITNLTQRGFTGTRTGRWPFRVYTETRHAFPFIGKIGVTPYACGYEMTFDEHNVEPWPRPPSHCPLTQGDVDNFMARASISQSEQVARAIGLNTKRDVLPPNVTGRMLDELAATGKMWRDLDAQTVWAAFRKALTS